MACSHSHSHLHSHSHECSHSHSHSHATGDDGRNCSRSRIVVVVVVVVVVETALPPSTANLFGCRPPLLFLFLLLPSCRSSVQSSRRDWFACLPFRTTASRMPSFVGSVFSEMILHSKPLDSKSDSNDWNWNWNWNNWNWNNWNNWNWNTSLDNSNWHLPRRGWAASDRTTSGPPE